MDYDVLPVNEYNGCGTLTALPITQASTNTIVWPDPPYDPFRPQTTYPTISWWYSTPSKTAVDLFEDLVHALNLLEGTIGGSDSKVSAEFLDELRKRVRKHELSRLNQRLSR